jgi:hypothetical protein
MRSARVSEPTVVVVLRRNSAVVPAALPGRGYRIHHTLSMGRIVSTFIGLAGRTGVGGGRILGGIELLIEQTSILSLTSDMGATFGLPCGVEGSSSLSPEDEDDRDDPKESSDEEESGEGRRGVARMVLEGEARISVGGRI